MEEVKVHKGQCRHRLDNRDSTQGDARVVASCDGVLVEAMVCPTEHLRKTDGGGGLEGGTEEEWGSGAYSPKQSATVVRRLLDFSRRGGVEGVVAGRSLSRGKSEAVTDLEASCGIDTHHSTGQTAGELVIEGLS